MKKGLTSIKAGQTNKVVKLERPAVGKDTHKEKKMRKSMTVGQTKLGVTLVLRKDDCQKLGFGSETPTSEVIRAVKAKLGV